MTFEKQEDAVKAIEDYNGAYLDEKVLVVQYDMVPHMGKVGMIFVFEAVI